MAGVTVDGWLDRKATAEFLDVSEWWLEKHHKNLDVAPPYIKHGRKVWYKLEVLRAWLCDEEKVARMREASGSTLASLYRLTKRRPDAPLPNTAELESRYLSEHGPTDVVVPRRVWDQLKVTFSQAQRSIVKNRLEAAT